VNKGALSPTSEAGIYNFVSFGGKIKLFIPQDLVKLDSLQSISHHCG